MARPKGVAESKPRRTATRKMAEAAGAEGVLPADIMLKVARHHWAKAIDETGAITDEDEALKAFEAAEKAAPYYNARLASTTVKGDADNPLQFVARLPAVASREEWGKSK